MAHQSSELYANTVFNLLRDLITTDGKLQVNLEDEIHRAVLVLHDGKLMWPPPKPPQPRAGGPTAAPAPPAVKPAPQTPAGMTARGRLGIAFVAALLCVAGLLGPPAFLQHLTVFLLACVVGWHVVWNVSPALHTPLMSVTNAISGIILIGGMEVLRGGGNSVAAVLGAVAILLASINVAGGFLVTQRMLRMFRK
jgi:NAD(P) transhydrogenase subunit alpha